MRVALSISSNCAGERYVLSSKEYAVGYIGNSRFFQYSEQRYTINVKSIECYWQWLGGADQYEAALLSSCQLTDFDDREV